METSQFEAVKVSLKQDKDGFILTLRVHPDDIDEKILRDFVGARYQVVMVRLNGHDQPMERARDIPLNPVQLSGVLCRDLDFIEYLFTSNQIKEPSELAAVEWLRVQLNIQSRSELKSNPAAVKALIQINEAFNEWKRN